MRLLYITLTVAALSVGAYLSRDLRGTLNDAPERTMTSSGTEIPNPNGPAATVLEPLSVLDRDVQIRVHELLADQQDKSGGIEGDSRTPHVVRAGSQPIRHPARLHDQMITPGNFEYVGAFRPPHVEFDGVTFGYGGWGIAYRPDGDPDGADDGFPGSLFLVGHPQHQLVAELSIPVPFVSRLKLADELPVGHVLQPFFDVTGGVQKAMSGDSSEPFQIGGLLVTGHKLHWTLHKFYNVQGIDYPSHGTAELGQIPTKAAGPWHLGPADTGIPEWHSYKHAGYILEIPQSEADQWFGGRNLISGLQISTGLQYSSQGPAMFAYRLPNENLPPGSTLDAVPLCWYSEEQPLPGHHPADRWTGSAWLTLGKKQAVIVVGRISHGEVHYGEPRPGDCSPYKGYHGPPYDVEVAFYSPASLIHVAHGSTPALGLAPWLRWTNTFDGGSISQYLFRTCGQDVGGLAYDRDHNLLYLTQIDAALTSDNKFETLPIIHVFRIVE
jgi:hypothetical protein